MRPKARETFACIFLLGRVQKGPNGPIPCPAGQTRQRLTPGLGDWGLPTCTARLRVCPWGEGFPGAASPYARLLP